MAGREAEEEFPCSACSELLPEEVEKKTQKTGLGLCGSAEPSRPLLVLMRLRPFNPFSLCAEVPTCFCPVPSTLSGTVDPGWACRHLEDRMSVVPVFAFPKWGRKSAAL